MLYISACVSLLYLLLTADTAVGLASPQGSLSAEQNRRTRTRTLQPSTTGDYYYPTPPPEEKFLLKMTTIKEKDEYWASVDTTPLDLTVVASPDQRVATKVSFMGTKLIFHAVWGDRFFNWDNNTVLPNVYSGILTDQDGIMGMQIDERGWLFWFGAKSDIAGWMICSQIDSRYHLFFLDNNLMDPPDMCKRVEIMALPWE
ncbi:hypothetical protein ACJ72_07020 [Emergomyces africanus]|uniref:Uncharacterized protein n=1 Tax=Emergomyces africanus TaxID=1955775 RepID=A0A1B7NPE4_9EURO|nr:hypothetical protein ACJ72_07020 [Emergomyces africanus]